jgi:hypothetical protein
MMHALMTWAALGTISVYTVPAILLFMVAIFIGITVALRRKSKT